MSAVKFFQFFVMKTLDSDSQLEKTLDPDPY
jgi:hypothetical protein